MPRPLDLVVLGGGEALRVRVALEEFIVDRIHLAGAGFLQHDLGYEDAVGVAGAPELVIVAVLRPPGEQHGRERFSHAVHRGGRELIGFAWVWPTPGLS